jgi:hypothetical protein
MRFAAFVLAMSASGCSLIGFVGGAGVDAVRKLPPVPVSPDSLFALRNGSRLGLILLDSTAVEGKKLRPRPSDYDSTASLAVLRILRTAKRDSLKGDTLVVPISQVARAAVPGRPAAARKAAAAGAKGDIVVLKVAVAVVVAAALVVLIFGLILSSSGFSF